MENKLVIIHKNEPRIGTSLIAVGFERQHKIVLELVTRYAEDFEEFGSLKRHKLVSKKRGRPVDEYILNEDQFLLLCTYFKNTHIARAFKKKLIKEFSNARRQLAAARMRQASAEWIASRDFGKKQRLALTDTIKEFVEYAKEHGSKRADWYYATISKMVVGLLFILDGKYQNIRDVLSDHQLVVLASAEQIITKGLRDGMKAKTFYKDIYRQIKDNVIQFAGLTGQSHVIEEQLKLEEK